MAEFTTASTFLQTEPIVVNYAADAQRAPVPVTMIVNETANVVVSSSSTIRLSLLGVGR